MKKKFFLQTITYFFLTAIVIFPMRMTAAEMPSDSPNPYVNIIRNMDAPADENNIYDLEDLEHKPLTAYKLTTPLIMLNGEFAVQARTVIENNHTLVPLRFLGERLGYRVDWNEKQKTVDVYKDNNHIKFEIGGHTPAKLIGNKVYVPTRAIAEALNAKITYFEFPNFTEKIAVIEITSNPSQDVLLSQEDAIKKVKETVYSLAFLNQETREYLKQYGGITFPNTATPENFLENTKDKLVAEYRGKLGRYYVINVIPQYSEGFLVDQYKGNIFAYHGWSVVALNIDGFLSGFIKWFQ